MQTTSASLLERLRQPRAQEAWTRFVQLGTPLLCAWARRLGLRDADAADLVQDVLTVLVQKLPRFDYDSGQSFRGWLRVILQNKWRDHCRKRAANPHIVAGEPLSGIAGPDDPDAFSEAEYRQHLVGRALKLMQADFAPATWQAFWECQVNGRPAAEVAVELSLTRNAIYLARGRILRRLREELAGLLD